MTQMIRARPTAAPIHASILDMSDMDLSRPLAPAPLHILLALVEGPSHGYAVLQAVRAQSAGRVPLGTGSFYRHLAKLIDGGPVAEAPAPKADDDPRRGTYYRLTEKGRQVLARAKRRMSDLVHALDGLAVAP